jgi:hypothetical protein
MFAALIVPPSPGPVPDPVGVCVPGRDGVPGSILGHLMCGTWGEGAATGVWHLVRDRWPLILLATTALVAARVGWVMWRRRVWRRHAAGARWLAITPPVTATPAATVGLWRLLATVLPAPGRWSLRPTRLVWEVVADPDGTRCGLWVPPGVNPTAVLRALHRGWPGVRAEQTTPPRVPITGAVVGLEVRPPHPDWLPLFASSPNNRSTFDTSRPEDDRVRAVYDGIATAGRTGGGILQVHISRAPAHRMRVLRRAMTNPDRAGHTRGVVRVVGLIADGLRMLMLGVLDVITPGSSARSAPSVRTDPILAEQARQARAKHADAPHLLVGVYAVATGPRKAAALAAAMEISSGFASLSAHFAHRRLRYLTAAARRWIPADRMSLASVSEVAAMAGLPAEPAAYGLPGAASRRRTPIRDTFRASAEEMRRRKAAETEPPTNNDDEDPPAVWSTS